MFSLLLVIIYISFISLGLPDSILGSAWPLMYGELNVPISYAGIISMIISFCTIISSLMSDKLIRKLGTGLVTAISVGMTAVALMGFSVSNSFILLCIIAVPYGLGAGSVDAALNNYVALHYESKHMSWLHCFWGIGATLGPYIMGLCLTNNLTWNDGYRVISLIQITLTIILIISLPMWKKNEKEASEQVTEQHSFRLIDLLKLPKAKPLLIAFFCYSAFEALAGLWASSYMVLYRGISESTAASWASLFYLGITAGRLISGFLATRLNDKNLVRCGQAILFIGCIILILPLGNIAVLIGLILVGVGCGPIYPSLLHETPVNFGADISQSIMGMQMACAYTGSTFVPPLFGILAEHVSIAFYPFIILAILILQVVLVERVNRKSADTK